MCGNCIEEIRDIRDLKNDSDKMTAFDLKNFICKFEEEVHLTWKLSEEWKQLLRYQGRQCLQSLQEVSRNVLGTCFKWGHSRTLDIPISTKFYANHAMLSVQNYVYSRIFFSDLPNWKTFVTQFFSRIYVNNSWMWSILQTDEAHLNFQCSAKM